MNDKTIPQPANAPEKNRIKSLQSKLVGIAVVAVVLWIAGARIYRSYFDDGITITHRPTAPVTPVRDAQFWIEEELEKIGGSDTSGFALQERDAVVPPLFDRLQKCGAVRAEMLKTLSPDAVRKLTQEGAWQGDERNAWLVAAQENAAYMFKVEVMDVSVRRGNVDKVKFRYSLFDTKDHSLIWQAETQRIPGFFVGRVPNANKQADNVIADMQASGLLPANCLVSR
jgi:hypothetical protein